MKRLIYNFDGTSNEYDDAYPTNVVMMQKAIAENSNDGIEQYSFYLNGVGSDTGEKVLGGAFGLGLFENIVGAYTHLCQYYEPGDEIYIFGFSRGAYTARSFAGMIGWCSIVDADKLDQIGNAQTYYKQRLLHEEHHVERFNQWRMKNCTAVCANDSDLKYRQKFKEQHDNTNPTPNIISIRYIGVWDTVRTLGATDKFYRWHDDDLSSKVNYARHAIALDERRKKFNVTVWDNIHVLNQNALKQRRNGKPYQQLWFPGTHGSVGGGGRIRGLSDEAFQWVREGAREAGLAFIDNPEAEIFSLQPNPLTWIYNSEGEADTLWKKTKKFSFNVLYFALGMIDREGPKSIDDVHQSTVIRYFSPSQYLPEKKSYRPASLRKIFHALAIKGAPFSEEKYNILYETQRSDEVKTHDQKRVTISGKHYLIHMVTKGETLSIIAKNLTGDVQNYRILHGINEASIPNENIIYIGQRILIPIEMLVV